MKRLLLLFIVALFAFTTLKTDTEPTTYMDFDDLEHPEVVVV